MNPGPAISIEVAWAGGSACSASTSEAASARGLVPARLAVDQGDVGRPVAVLTTGRALEVDRGGVDVEVETVALGDGGERRG